MKTNKVEQDYLKRHLELEIKKKLIQDLIKKTKLLRRAIIKLHDLKLESVNRSLKDMWSFLPLSAREEGKDGIATIEVVHDAEEGDKGGVG